MFAKGFQISLKFLKDSWMSWKDNQTFYTTKRIIKKKMIMVWLMWSAPGLQGVASCDFGPTK